MFATAVPFPKSRGPLLSETDGEDEGPDNAEKRLLAVEQVLGGHLIYGIDGNGWVVSCGFDGLSGGSILCHLAASADAVKEGVALEDEDPREDLTALPLNSME